MNIANVTGRLRRFEGWAHWMYLDTGGLPTAGCGHAMSTLATAHALPWRTPARNLATPWQIDADYTALKQAPQGLALAAYERYTVCRLSDEAVDRLLGGDIAAFQKQIERALPDFPSYPEAAQEALFDMAYNLGVAGLLKYHRMLAAIDNASRGVGPDWWLVASEECHRNGIGDERNKETAALFESLRQA